VPSRLKIIFRSAKNIPKLTKQIEVYSSGSKSIKFVHNITIYCLYCEHTKWENVDILLPAILFCRHFRFFLNVISNKKIMIFINIFHLLHMKSFCILAFFLKHPVNGILAFFLKHPVNGQFNKCPKALLINDFNFL
jgi:hypothetical protein